MLGTLAADGLMPVSYHPSEDERWDDAEHRGQIAHRERPRRDRRRCRPGRRGGHQHLRLPRGLKDESLAVIKDAVRAKEAGRVKRVVVAGCLVQRHARRCSSGEPGIDAMIGVFDRDKVIEAVRGIRPERRDSTMRASHPNTGCAACCP